MQVLETVQKMASISNSRRRKVLTLHGHFLETLVSKTTCCLRLVFAAPLTSISLTSISLTSISLLVSMPLVQYILIQTYSEYVHVHSHIVKISYVSVRESFQIVSFMHSSNNSDTDLLNSSIDVSSLCTFIPSRQGSAQAKRSCGYDYLTSTRAHVPQYWHQT